jgi:Rieske Fe-S protein
MKLVTRRIVGLGFISSLFSLAFPALAATKPPIACRFVGQRTTFAGKIFTCVKVTTKGKSKLQWDSGKFLPSVSPSVTPNSTPTSSISAPAVPTTINKIEIPLGKSSEVPLNGLKIFTAKNRYGNSSGYVVMRNSNGVIAMSDICPHKGCSVEIQKEGLLCPCHNALFDSKTGDVLRGPASYPLERVTVRELDGVIYVTD